MPNENTGRPGTITQAEFDQLSNLVDRAGAKTVLGKIAKACERKAASLRHEYYDSAVAEGFDSVAGTLSDLAAEAATRKIAQADFDTISGWVDRYGPEAVARKIGKVCRRKAKLMREQGAVNDQSALLQNLSEQIFETFDGHEVAS